MDMVKRFVNEHPQIASWIVLSIGMVAILVVVRTGRRSINHPVDRAHPSDHRRRRPVGVDHRLGG